MQKNNNSFYFYTKPIKKLTRVWLNSKISPLRSFFPSVNQEATKTLQELFEKEKLRAWDKLLLIQQRRIKKRYKSLRKWDAKAARVVFSQLLPSMSIIYKSWSTSKYGSARWRAAFNVSDKTSQSVDNFYKSIETRFIWKNSKKFDKLVTYFPVITKGVKPFSTIDYLNYVLALDPIYNLSIPKFKKIGRKYVNVGRERINFKEMSQVPEEFFKKPVFSFKSLDNEKDNAKNSDMLTDSLKPEKKSPDQLRADILANSVKFRKFPLNRVIFKTFKHFYVFFKQQQWLAALFSVFNKNGKKKIAINFYLNIIVFLKKKYRKSSTSFVPLYFNQIMMNVMPWFGFKTVVKKRKRYRYPYIAFSDNSVQRFRQNKQLSIKWLKLAIFHETRTELTIFLKLWSVLQVTRYHRGRACFLRFKYQQSFLKKRGWLQLKWAARWI